MLDVIVLSFVLSQPVKGNTSEEEQRFCFDSAPGRTIEQGPQFKIISLTGNANIRNISVKEYSTAPERRLEPAKLAVTFQGLADNWSANTRHISSTKDLTSDPDYRQIIGLGWDVVPLLLRDLQENRRFWFPALYAITKVRPFDPSDAGNSKRMTDAWITWGKRKGLI